MSRMKHHFNVIVDAKESDGEIMAREVISGWEELIHNVVSTLSLDRNVEVTYVETFDADKEERGGE